MRWVKVDNYAIRTEDGTYSVCKIGTGRDSFYEVWRTRAHKDGPHLVAHNLKDAKEAKRLAAEDAAE